jgi:hypothetical protein
VQLSLHSGFLFSLFLVCGREASSRLRFVSCDEKGSRPLWAPAPFFAQTLFSHAGAVFLSFGKDCGFSSFPARRGRARSPLKRLPAKCPQRRSSSPCRRILPLLKARLQKAPPPALPEGGIRRPPPRKAGAALHRAFTGLFCCALVSVCVPNRSLFWEDRPFLSAARRFVLRPPRICRPFAGAARERDPLPRFLMPSAQRPG